LSATISLLVETNSLFLITGNCSPRAWIREDSDFPHTFRADPGNSRDSAGFWLLRSVESEPETVSFGLDERRRVRLSLLATWAVRIAEHTIENMHNFRSCACIRSADFWHNTPSLIRTFRVEARRESAPRLLFALMARQAIIHL
jgi:hypothetical protein